MNEATRPAPPLSDAAAFALRSLDDLEDERRAGDVTDADYRRLRDLYMARAAEALRSADRDRALDPPPESDGDDPADAMDDTAGPGSATGSVAVVAPRRRRSLLVGGIACLVVAATFLAVVVAAGIRLPGETATGTVSLSSAQQQQRTLAQAETLDADGRVADALALYRQVLARDPKQPEALAEAGWIEFEAGVTGSSTSLVGQGQHDEEEAEVVAPGAWAPHLYLGSMEMTEADFTAAAAEFRLLIADHPPTASLQAAMPTVRRAFALAGETPPALPPAVSSTG